MADKLTGRIIRSISGFYDVQTSSGLVNCRARGILRKDGQSPLTGDMVEITVERGKGMVERILPRRNRFVRPAVANLDALVVFAANVNPVTEPFLIDRVRSVVSDSLQPHESQHARPPCPSSTPGVHSDTHPSSSDAIQPSHPLSSPSPLAPNPSQHQSLFQ